MSELDARLALELAGTIRGFPPSERDLLGGPRELRGWLAERGLHQPGLELRLGDFRDLRAAVRSLLGAAMAGRGLPQDATEAVNAATAAAPNHLRLDADGSSAPAVLVETGSPAARVLARIARSAIELVSDASRVRVCRAPGCGRFFETTRPGRMWCSIACGNRVRVARHRSVHRLPA